MTNQKGWLTFLVFLFSIYRCYASLPIECGANEVWNSGFSPEPTCENMFPNVDYYSFRHGCFCKENHIRNETNGTCIQIKNCPQFLNSTEQTAAVDGIIAPHNECPANETWREGIDPEPSCDILFPKMTGFREGCYCDDGFVRNASGNCTQIFECPGFEDWIAQERAIQSSIKKDCTPGETFRLDCNICKCTEDGKPVCTFHNCTEPEIPLTHRTAVIHDPHCPEGEVYREGFHPQATCDDLFPIVDSYTTKPGCFCKINLVRDQKGNCIRVSKCPQYIWPTDPKSDFELGAFQIDESLWNQGGCLNHIKGHGRFGYGTPIDETSVAINQNQPDPSSSTGSSGGGLHISDPLYFIEAILSKLNPKKCECQTFGDYIALKLQKVGDHQKNILMNIINNAIFHADLGNYNKEPSSKNPGYSFLSNLFND